MTSILYGITLILLGISIVKDRQKTKRALKKALMTFLNILPQLLVVILLVAVLLSLLDEQLILAVIGTDSGFFGVLLSAIVGSVTLIPGFVAFPTAAMLLEQGAGIMQIAAFVSTLMMVGIVTLPVEIRYFSKPLVIYRNSLAFLFSLLVALIIGTVEALV